LFRSCTPDFIEDAEQNQHQAAPDKNDSLNPIVADDGHVILDVSIAIEKLVSPPPDENSGKQKDDYSESEPGTQRRNARLFNQRHQRSYLVSN
jgi:hypothetical protein